MAGVDEAGRGCLAGPVVAAAVVLDPTRHIAGVRDSKLLSPAERCRLYDQILTTAAAWAVAVAEPHEIDHLNIHRASLQAMHEAVTALDPLPDFVLVDAFSIPDLLIPSVAWSTATGARRPLRPRQSWPRSHVIARWRSYTTRTRGTDSIVTRAMRPPRTWRR